MPSRLNKRLTKTISTELSQVLPTCIVAIICKYVVSTESEKMCAILNDHTNQCGYGKLVVPGLVEITWDKSNQEYKDMKYYIHATDPKFTLHVLPYVWFTDLFPSDHGSAISILYKAGWIIPPTKRYYQFMFELFERYR